MQSPRTASDTSPPPPPAAASPPPPTAQLRIVRAFKPSTLRDAQLYYSMPEAAAILGWGTRRARRWLRKNGACVQRGLHWYTTKGLLRRALPEESGEFIAMLDANREAAVL